MSAFFQALGQGYTPQQILGYLSKSVPAMSKPIQKAQKAGYSVQQILGFLSKNFDQQDRRGMTETERHTANRRADAERTKYGLKMAATAAAVPIASTALSSALSRSLPQSLRSLAPSLAGQSALPGGGNARMPQAGNILPGTQIPPTSPQPQTNQPQPTAQTVLPSASQQPPNLGNVTSVTQSATKPQLDFVGLKNKYKGFFDKIDQLKQTGNNVDTISAYFRKFAPSQSEKFEKETGAKLEEIVGEYIAMQPEESTPNAEAKPSEAGQVMESPSQELDQSQAPERKTVAKEDVVSSPHGVGEVKEIRNGQALIDVDGKLHKVKEEELEASPIPEKDLAELYDELIQGIESETGEDVSRMVQWAGYNPETNTLQFLPHTGKLYKYGNISPEDAALLTDILSTRKTSGENFIGAWKAGSKSPIGAALSKLIRKLQAERGGKGNEYEETHEPIYSAYEPAIQAKKKKKKK